MTAMKTTTHATGRQIATGAAWMMGFKLLDKSVGLISTLVLARVLTPTDFGLVAMAMAVVALLELMGAFGFESALIQRQNTDRSHYDTAWTFNVMFGVAISIMLLVMAMPAADFYREPRLALMLPALAVGALIGGFENIGTVAFRKELDFRKEFKFLLAKRLAAFTVTITLALTFQSFWALIAGTVTGKLMAVFISYRLHPYRPRLTLAARDDLLHFSKWIFISNLIQFLHSRSTDFILGRTVGSHGLGVYNIASEIAAMPSTELIAPLNRAVYPAYARLAGARDQLWERFLEVFGIICLLAFPVAVGL
jgi:O-antigen/teichoic acid export membrane protein